MKCCLQLLAILFTVNAAAQTNIPGSKTRMLQVENSLAENVVYGDTIVKLNLQKQMDAYKIKGVSIAVIKDYKIDWANGYGWADAEEKRQVTPETRFQAASISKSLNSLALLKLVQQGKMDLETDINIYLKTWKFPYDSLSKNKKISLANLLSHTAGLSVHGFPGYTPGDSIPSLVQVLNGERPANSSAVRSLFEPSAKLEYSGGGTTITQLILTDITGMRYEDFLQKEVLQAIGMTNSFFTQPPPPGTKNLATAYHGDGTPVKGKYHVYPEQAAAGLWTTPTDLAKYIIETQLEYEGKSAKVLSQQMMQKRLTHYVDSAAALGLFLIRKQGETYFIHNGGNEGFSCTSYGSLKNGNGVVVMTNGENFSIIPEIVNSVALIYGWKDFYKPVFKKVNLLPKATLEKYTGNYLLAKDTLSIRFCGDQLCIWQNNQPANGYKMIFGSPVEFSAKEVPNASILILLDSAGKAEALEINQNGAKIRADKIR